MKVIDISKFIQQIQVPITGKKLAIDESKIETFLLTLLKKGLGIWKDYSNDFPKLIIEFKKNTIDKELLKQIQSHQNELFYYLEIDKKYYPLSSSQEMMCLQTELFKNSSYQLTVPFYINYEIKKKLLVESVNSIINRHAILRTAFPKIQHQWVQIVLPTIQPDISFIDLSHTSSEEQTQQITLLLEQEKSVRIRIEIPPLFRILLLKLNPKRYLIIINSHHAIFDGISYSIFMHELITCYQSLEQKKSNNLPILQANYTDFVLDQKGNLKEIKQKEIQWWKKQLEDCPLQINFDQNDKQKEYSLSKEKSEILRFNFSEMSAKKFISFCKQLNVSITLFFFSGIFILIKKITHQDDLIIGTVLNQRNRLEYENLIGDFNNVIPMRMKINDDITGEDLIKQLQIKFFDAFSHQKLTFNELVNQLNIKRNKNNLTFYNVFFDSLNLDAFQRNFDQNHIELPKEEAIQSQILPLMDLFFLLIQKSEQFDLLCSFNKKLFNTTIINSLFSYLEKILINLIQEPNQPLHHYLKNDPSLNLRKRSIFCIPGADGQVDIFQRITHQIQSYKCYAIKYKLSEKIKTISEIANNFIHVIQTNTLVPDSILMGLSTGGIVSFEMIHQLRKIAPNKITQLILLDPPILYDYKILVNENEEFILTLVMNYAQKMFGSNQQIDSGYFISNLHELTVKQKEKIVYDWIKANTKISILSFNFFQEWIDLLGANLKALSSYEPKPFLGNLNVCIIAASSNKSPLGLLYPKLENPENLNKLDYWKALLPNCTVEDYIIPNTNHYSLFSKQNVKILQTILTNLLEQKGDHK